MNRTNTLMICAWLVGASVATNLVAETFTGLVFDNRGRESDKHGFFQMNVTPGGRFSGHLTVGQGGVSVGGQLDARGEATVFLGGGFGGRSTWVFYLSVDADHERFSGSVAYNGTFAWSGTLDGRRAVTVDRQHPLATAGQYTLLLPGNLTNAISPIGACYGTVTVRPNGTVAVTGATADGQPFTQSVLLTEDGSWPFYVPLYGGKGFLFGWLSVATQDGTDVSGLLNWYKPTNPRSASYPEGFNYQANAVGYRYTPPARGDGMVSWESGTALFTDGNLEGSTSHAVVVNKAHALVLATRTPDRCTLVCKPSSGLVTGSFLHPVSGKVVRFGGVVLQPLDEIFGSFPGSSLGGTFQLTSP